MIVGATWPEQLKRIRKIVGDKMLFLIPGVGVQGGNSIESIIKAGKNSIGAGMIINSSRNITTLFTPQIKKISLKKQKKKQLNYEI